MKINSTDMTQLESLNGRPLKVGGAPADKEAVLAKKVGREFEALFVGLMLKSMRSTVGKDLLAGKENNEETYRSLLDQEYAKAVAEQGGLGLAKVIERQLLKRQQPTPTVVMDEAGGERR